MTAHPSFMAYDRRSDPLELINREERLKWELHVFFLILGLALLATILHFTVEPHTGVKKAEAAQPVVCGNKTTMFNGKVIERTPFCVDITDSVVDDKVLCSNPLTESREIGEYCYSLMTRGL